MNCLEHAQQILGTWVQQWTTPEDDRLDGQIITGNLLDAIKALNEDCWGYLLAITGLDHGVDTGVMEALYHFGAGAAVLTLRVTVPHDQAVIPTICEVIPYASVFERELSEMFGIEVTNTPDASRLYLPDDWEQGVYPLRKDIQKG